MKKYKAIIFDFGETLAFVPGRKEQTAHLRSQLNEEEFETLHSLFVEAHARKLTPGEILSLFQDRHSIDPEQEQSIKKWLPHQGHDLYPETRQVLMELRARGLKLGLLSNCPVTIKGEIEVLELAPLFDEIVLSYEVELTKPEPEIFKIMLRKLGVSAGETIMIGNEFRKDVEGARNAGIDALLLDRSNPSKENESISDLSELLKIV